MLLNTTVLKNNSYYSNSNIEINLKSSVDEL